MPVSLVTRSAQTWRRADRYQALGRLARSPFLRKSPHTAFRLGGSGEGRYSVTLPKLRVAGSSPVARSEESTWYSAGSCQSKRRRTRVGDGSGKQLGKQVGQLGSDGRPCPTGADAAGVSCRRWVPTGISTSIGELPTAPKDSGGGPTARPEPDPSPTAPSHVLHPSPITAGRPRHRHPNAGCCPVGAAQSATAREDPGLLGVPGDHPNQRPAVSGPASAGRAIFSHIAAKGD